MLTLYQNMRKYKLNVVQHVGLHGSISSNGDFMKVLGDKAKTPGTQARPE